MRYLTTSSAATNGQPNHAKSQSGSLPGGQKESNANHTRHDSLPILSTVTYPPGPDATSPDQLPMTTAPSANNQKHKTIYSSVPNNNCGKRNFLLNYFNI
jgi:hypothetical protein